MIDYVQNTEENFSEWLCNICETYEIKASQLARAISTKERKVNRSTISLWRSDQRLPSCALRVRLAVYLAEQEVDCFNQLIREILWRVHVSEWRSENA